MAHVPDAVILDRARKRAGLSLDDLWVTYFGLGGKADPIEFEGFFAGVIRPTSFEYNIAAQALNEHFIDRGENHPVPYA